MRFSPLSPRKMMRKVNITGIVCLRRTRESVVSGPDEVIGELKGETFLGRWIPYLRSLKTEALMCSRKYPYQRPYGGGPCS